MSPSRLVVVLYGARAGTIERDGGTLSFRYDPAYLEQANATPLSLSMPLTTTRYTNKWVEAYLRGLLPDNDDVRRRWAAHFHLRDRDTFGLVAAVGGDAAGGALFLAETDELVAPAHGLVQPLTEHDVAQRLRRLRADDTDWLGDGEHWSLAGAQGKFALRQSGDGWGVAHGIEPSTHIVKPGISRIPGQALVEHVSMVALRTVGLDVAQTRYVEFEDQPAIVVTRFDRRLQHGTWQRIHQEDLCQALALDPVRKYEQDGGPGVQKIADLLRADTRDDSLERFAQAVVANHLLGAPDAHAKNFSLLLVARQARLAPLYDVASGLTVERDGGLRFPRGAMSIGGERLFGELTGVHWDRFAARVGVPAERVRAWVAQLADTLPDAVSDATAELPARRRAEARLPTLAARVGELARLTRDGLSVAERPTGGARRRSDGPGAQRLMAAGREGSPT